MYWILPICSGNKIFNKLLTDIWNFNKITNFYPIYRKTTRTAINENIGLIWNMKIIASLNKTETWAGQQCCK